MRTKNLTKMAALLLALLTMALSLTACANQPATTPENEAATIATDENENAAVIDKDREGNPIILPETINKIISMGPSNTEILTALGFADHIIAADTYSAGIQGLAADIPLFSMIELDGEQLIALEPDVVIVTGMSMVGGSNPYQVIADAGICVISIPSSVSIAGIKEDIRYLAAVMKATEQGETIIATMESEIDQIAQIGASITDRKSVYFEISAAPYMYSFGSGVFLDEMLTIIGADNILAEQESWLSVADETILDKNPDVVLTSVNYLDDPIAEIMARPGWEEITAVQNAEVHYIDTDSSNRPSQHIVKALQEMAKAVYPEQYQ